MTDRATTVRFSDYVYERMEQASDLTGLPINSIVVMACLDWLESHAFEPSPGDLGPPLWHAWPAPGSRRLRLERRWRKGGWFGFGGAGRRGRRPFDRFSAGAARVLEAAQEEAQRLGHGWIGTEHLTLALVQDTEDEAGRVLRELGVKLDGIRERLVKMLAAGAASGSDEPSAGRPPDVVPTSRTKKVLELALESTAVTGSEHVRAEHILLALLAEGHGIGAQLLGEVGVTEAAVRERLSRPPTAEG